MAANDDVLAAIQALSKNIDDQASDGRQLLGNLMQRQADIDKAPQELKDFGDRGRAFAACRCG